MRIINFGVLAGVLLAATFTGCRTHQRVPDYLPRAVVANQVGNAVVYDTNDPRNSTVQPVATGASPADLSRSGGQVEASGPQAGAVKRQTLYGQPDGVSVSDKGLREATILWAMPQEDVYRYRIERADSPNGPFVKIDELAPKKLQYRDKGTAEFPLKDDTPYYYQIVAILDRDGQESIPSKVVKAQTAPPPLAPMEVKAVASGSRAVTIIWQPSQSDGVTGYRVERAPAAGPGAFEVIGQVRVPSLVDGGTPASTLKDSTRYLYRVVTINRVNSESTVSQSAAVTTLPPPAVVQKVVTVSDEVRCVPLSWAPGPEQDIVRYDVYRARSAKGGFEKIGQVAGRTTVSYLDGGGNPGNLEDEAIYYYRVRAVNAVTSESADSEAVQAVTRGVPPEVVGVTAIGNHPREIPLSWAVNTDKTVRGYEIWRSEEGQDDWSQLSRISGRDTTNYLDRGELRTKPGLGQLKDATVYQYKVIAFNSANVKSSASMPAAARTKYRPVAPTGLTVTTNVPLSIRLSWNSNPEKDVSGYVVEWSDESDGSFRKLVTVTALREGKPSAKEMALSSGAVRYYRIKALDREGLESDWSVIGHGRAKPVPDAPVSLTAEQVGSNIRVTWKASAQPDVRRYKVWSKKFFGWELISALEQTSYLFEFTELSKPMTIAVSAVDQDELESEKSESIEIKPGI